VAKKKKSEKESFGLIANGSSGDWDISVDEATAGAGRWFVQIESRSAYLSFQIASPKVISDAHGFLELDSTNLCCAVDSEQAVYRISKTLGF